MYSTFFYKKYRFRLVLSKPAAVQNLSYILYQLAPIIMSKMKSTTINANADPPP